VLAFGVEFHPTSWWAFAGVFVLALLALYGLGMVFASTFLMWGREAWHIVNLLQEPVYLLSGLHYPVRTLGVVVGAVAAILPLTLGVDALRQVLFGDKARGLLPLGWEIGLLAALAVLFILLAMGCLKVLERKARDEGRLTVRGQ
jgi:ABC-2 type transport system permease protein